MKLEAFPGCCGGAIFTGFYGTNNQLNDRYEDPVTPSGDIKTPEGLAEWVADVRAFIDTMIRDGMERDIANVHNRPYGPKTIGFYQAVLNVTQVAIFHDTLIDLGFRVVAKEVLNVRYGSKMTVYIRVTHGENNA